MSGTFWDCSYDFIIVVMIVAYDFRDIALHHFNRKINFKGKRAISEEKNNILSVFYEIFGTAFFVVYRAIFCLKR